MQSLAVRPIELSIARRSSRDDDLGFGAKRQHSYPSEFSITEGVLVRRHQGAWTNANAMVADIYCEHGLDIELKFEQSSIVMPLEEVGGRADIRPSEAGLSKMQSTSQSGVPITLLPPGLLVSSRSQSLKFLRVFTLELDEEAFLTRDGVPVKIQQAATGVFEPRLSNICRLLAQECRAPDSNGLAYADTLVLALGMALSRFDHTERKQFPKGGLAPWQLRRVQEFMSENIAATVSIKTLADLTQISITHFSRAFKASVGCAPHQWMTENRIERAKRFLLTGEMAIVEISLTLGFCDQAHFTRVFRKAVGDTPLAWQRTRRG